MNAEVTAENRPALLAPANQNPGRNSQVSGQSLSNESTLSLVDPHPGMHESFAGEFKDGNRKDRGTVVLGGGNGGRGYQGRRGSDLIPISLSAELQP